MEEENYGVCAGDGLLLIDADKEPLISLLKEKTPQTFTVRSPGHNAPQYYLKLVDGSLSNLTLHYGIDEKGHPLNIGHVQAARKYLVGPGSMHPNGGTYKVLDDASIATITASDLQAIFQPFLIRAAREKREVEGREAKRQSLENFDFDIASIAPSGLKRSGDELYGPHPVHSSTTGRNFRINLKLNCWCCYRCGTGGGSLSLLAILEGIIDCSEAIPGGLRGEKFRQTLEKALARGLVKGPPQLTPASMAPLGRRGTPSPRFLLYQIER